MFAYRFVRLVSSCLVVVVCMFSGTAAGTVAGGGRRGAGASTVDDHQSLTTPAAEPLARTFMVSESSGAACLDGSLPRYWVQPATVPSDSNRWAVHMQGGGWW